MEIEICTIDLSKGNLDNEYTFYESGRIKHFYDRNAFKLNIESWLSASQISEEIRTILLDKCPIDSKEKVNQILHQ